MSDADVWAEVPVAAFEANGRRYDLLLPNAGRDHIQKSLLDSGRPYEAAMLEDMRARLAPGDLVLDLGANIGNHTLHLACVAGARVIAFEPNPDLCAALEANVRRNGVEDRVTARRLAIGDRPGRARFRAELPDNLGAQALDLGDGDIEVVTLDALDLAGPVRMIKIDVEGMEPEALRGAAALIARDRPILYVECQDEAAFRQVAAWAADAGYVCWDTFNATPTHLFLPGESLDVTRRLDRLAAREALQDHRLGLELRQSRRAQAASAGLAADLRRENAALRAEADRLRRTAAERGAAAARLREETAALRGETATLREEAAALRDALAARDAALADEKAQAAEAMRRHERQVSEIRTQIAQTRSELARMEKYARDLEGKYAAILTSETWRAMEPVRRLLRAVKRRPPPAPFTPRLSGARAPHAAPPSPGPSPGPSPAPAPRGAAAAPLFAPPAFGAGAPAQTVSVFMATYPAREGNLQAIVDAILPQCDLLHVYLNEYDVVPPALRHPRIRPTLGRDALGDLRDNGKFHNLAAAPDGYRVFIDDDIVYPADYVRRLVEGVKAFGYRAVVGFHGTIYKPPLESYLRDRAVLPFYAASRHALVDQLGTGTSGFHASTLALDPAGFETTGLADLWFAKQAAEQKVPLVALARPADWMLGMPEIDDTLFRQAQRDESRESALLRDRLAPALRAGPRAGAVSFLRSLYTPAHLERRRVDLAFSADGAFGVAEGAVSDVHFALIVAGWNCADKVAACMASVAAQAPGGYSFEILAYDDASDDATWERLEAAGERMRIRAFRGEENRGPAFARDALLRRVEDGQTICVLLDMDDALLPHALATLERTYRGNPDCWMTYGNWVNQRGEVNDQGVYAPGEIDSRAYRRQDVFKFTHLRSFRRFLYDRVTPEHLKDPDGEWLRYCSDVALMLPIADQCADRNVVALDQPMYLYNQYRATGTQKRFRDKKREAAQYLRERQAVQGYSQPSLAQGV